MADTVFAIVIGIVVIGTFTDFFPLAFAFGIAWLESRGRTRSSAKELRDGK